MKAGIQHPVPESSVESTALAHHVDTSHLRVFIHGLLQGSQVSGTYFIVQLLKKNPGSRHKVKYQNLHREKPQGEVE